MGKKRRSKTKDSIQEETHSEREIKRLVCGIADKVKRNEGLGGEIKNKGEEGCGKAERKKCVGGIEQK